MGKFLMTSKKSKEAAEKAAGSGGYARFKMGEKRLARLLILGPVGDESAIFSSTVHEKFGAKKLLGKAASPSYTGDKDKISDIGWKLRDKYMESTNSKKKDLWQSFMPKRPCYVNVLDLDDVDLGPLVYQMSGAVSEVVVEEFNKVGEDITSICDFDEGRILRIKSNGKPKLKRRYACELLDETANLIEDGVLTMETISEMADKVYDLKKLQPKFNEAAFEKFYQLLKKSAANLGINIEDFLGEEEEEVEEVEDDDDLIEDDDSVEVEEEADGIEDDIVTEEDETFEEEVEKPVAKKKSVAKKVATKKKRVAKRRAKA